MDRFEDAKLRVKEANDLVAWIESYVPLRPRGRTLVALCPFHQERSPSFTVFPETQHYYCFGCGKSGDVFSFVMEREGLSFREAMERLADKANISLEGVFGRGDGRPKGPDPFAVLAELRAFFQGLMRADEGEPARAYLESRGLDAAIEPWGLGVCPSQPGALLQFCERRKLPREVVDATGLLRANFQGRVLFPIEDERGRTVAFGARVVPGTVSAAERDGFEPPKYVNSPESPFFSKRRVLFGLHRAKQSGNRRIVVTEGYTDVIAAHLAGFTGTVATLGTAFTQDHARMVERYATEGLVLLFDGDRAGMQAAERASKELVNSRMPVRIALMTGAKDPGDFLVARAGEEPGALASRCAEFQGLIDGAADWLTVWFRLLRKRLDLSQAVHMEAAGRECAGLLALVQGDLRRESLLQEMARHLGMPPQKLQPLLKSKAGRPAEAAGEADAPATPPPPAPATPEQRAESDLLACVLADPSLTAAAADVPVADPLVAELLVLARQGHGLGRTAGKALVSYLFTQCTERGDLARVLAQAAARADSLREPRVLFDGLQQGRRRRQGKDAVRSLRQQLQAAVQAGDRAAADAITQRLVEELRLGAPRQQSSS